MNDTATPSSTAKIILKAPLSGPLVPLERVPDPVFAQKMVGDGISIDPLNQCLVAPCDGEVVQLHSAGHAVTLATVSGLEVMMHIGLDTVDLKGEGFTPKVNTGDKVKSGDELIEFDADYVATHARSLLTQIVITNSDRVAQFEPNSGLVSAGESVILELSLVETATDQGDRGGKSVTSEAIVIPNPTGLHARPAAVLANTAKRFQADIRLQRGDDKANAKSVVSIMGIEVNCSDKVHLIAQGVDAEAALETLVPLLREGLGDEGTPPVSAPASVTLAEDASPAPKPRSTDPNVLLGVSASPGLAVGNVFQVRQVEIEVEEKAAGEPVAEQLTLERAIEEAKVQLESLQAKLHAEADPAKAAIFAAHQELLMDPDLLDLVEAAIAKGKSAAFAWKRAYSTHADRLASLKNELLAARANDLRDVGQRVLKLITGTVPERPPTPPAAILMAEDLTPSDTANLDRSKVLGFCTLAGGASSHVAILARALDIPAVAGIEPRALELVDGTPVILDGNNGRLRLNPSSEEMARIKKRQEKQAERRKADIKTALEPAQTSDGHRMNVVANIGGEKEAQQAVSLGGEGVGLLRSEFLFLERATAPSEKEQLQIYKGVVEALGPDRSCVIRTLDVGGDKPLPYLPIPKEDNPFLGQRGIRVMLDRPEIFRVHLRAILRASEFGRVEIMFPMITHLTGLRAAKAILEEEREKVGVAPIPVGIMVEVPVVAVMAKQFASEVDFFSIGTNDLTQYTLAMDRGHPQLAPFVDSLNPGVLQLISDTVEAAHRLGKLVSVCGGIASDPQAVPILLGLGVDKLSLSVPAVPSIKAQIRGLNMIQCRKLASEALQQENAAGVRSLVPDPLGEEQE